MAIVTGVFLFMAFSLAKKRPDIFRELFRKHAGDPMVGDEGESESGDADVAVASRYEEAAEPSVTV